MSEMSEMLGEMRGREDRKMTVIDLTDLPLNR